MRTVLDGIWDVTVKTPIGRVEVEYVFEQTDGGLIGTANGSGESVPVSALTVRREADGEHVEWHQRVTRPMRLNLVFSVIVDGDTLSGHSRAGRLPRSVVTGTRRA